MILKMSGNAEKDIFEASCNHCGRKFMQYKALYVHVRRFHKDKPIPYKQNSNIICSICNEEQHLMKTYLKHIRTRHPEVKLSFEKKTFYSEEDFDNWLTDTEARTHTHFATARSQHVLSDGRIVQQYQCDRSGFYKPSVIVRSRKFSGSKKINKFCPAYIYRTTTVEGDLMEIEVNFQSTHAGHKFDLHSLRFRSEQRERRLRSKGKGRWPKKPENPPADNSVEDKDTNLEEQSKSFVDEISDILHRDPNLEIQHITCNCQEYTTVATCGHVKTILQTIETVKSSTTIESVGVDESNEIVDPSYVDVDLTTVVESDTNSVENNNRKESLEEKKTLIIKEFQELADTCQSWEHLEILKSIVIEGKRNLFPTIIKLQ